MLSIHLRELKFHGFHGVYAEERTLGNDYEVDLSVSFQPVALPVQHLDETLDYTQLYSIVKERMSRPAALLETLATEISTGIQSEFSAVSHIYISIKKLYPPVNSFEGSVGVSFEWHKPTS